MILFEKGILSHTHVLVFEECKEIYFSDATKTMSIIMIMFLRNVL